MLDPRFIRDNVDEVKKSVRARGKKVNVDKLIKLYDERNQVLQQVEEMRSETNFKGKPSPEALKKLQKAKDKKTELEKELQKVEKHLNQLLLQVPNLIDPSTPIGDESNNAVLRVVGEPTEITDAKDHIELGQKLNLLDFERGAKVAGSKFYFLKNQLVELEMALVNYAFDVMKQEGFELMTVPHMVNERTFIGTGFLAKGEESNTYETKDGMTLIASAEYPLTGYHTDEILTSDDLPRLYTAFSPSYRLEAGSYGKHAHGLFRVHQFDKVEMYVYCRPKESNEWFDRLLGISERIYQDLEVPYRVTQVASGDMGSKNYKQYDLEYYSPVDSEYRELTSCSNVTDFQSRRLMMRYRGGDGKPEYLHTLNNTAVAISRTLIALLENHQTSDGHIKIPKVLHGHLTFTSI